MKYISTQGGVSPVEFSEAVIEGLASDGGLFMPESYPQVSIEDLEKIKGKDYWVLANEIISKFIGDIESEDLKNIIKKTYTEEVFGSIQVTPIYNIEDNLWLQDLACGPTLAFKDVALQFLGNLFEYILEKRESYLNVLGATSGDTGSSAEHGVLGKKRVSIFMLSPLGKMSDFQTAQMYSLDNPNIHNIAVKGVFDDGQDLVKTVNRDSEFKEKYHIGAVNSINWARVAAQIAYYFYGYLQVVNKIGDKVDFAVPTGNFGDICAGCIAKQMGLPIRNLVLATNENNVLNEFFTTGVYQVRPTEEVIQTSSPSMDISKASNFERFLFDISGRKPEVVKEWMEKVKNRQVIDLKETSYWPLIQNSGIVSGSSTHNDRLRIIKYVYDKSEIIIDTHTADGIKVAMRYMDEKIPMICLATAKPTKFESTIKQALGFFPKRPEGFEDIEKKPQKNTSLEKGDLEGLKKYIAEHAIAA